MAVVMEMSDLIMMAATNCSGFEGDRKNTIAKSLSEQCASPKHGAGQEPSQAKLGRN